MSQLALAEMLMLAEPLQTEACGPTITHSNLKGKRPKFILNVTRRANLQKMHLQKWPNVSVPIRILTNIRQCSLIKLKLADS